MADKKKKTNLKRRGSFWRSYSFVLTLVVLVSFAVAGSSAFTSSRPSSAVPLSNFILSYNSSTEKYIFSQAGADGPRFGPVYSQSTYGVSVTVHAPTLNNPSYSRSGSSFVIPSRSVSYSFPSSSNYVTISPSGVCYGLFSNDLGPVDWYGNIMITFPDDVTNYQLFGNIVVRTVIGSRTFSHTIDVSTDLISSSSPISKDGFSFAIPTYVNTSLTSSGSTTFSSTIDFSGVYVATNYDPTIMRLTLPSGTYLGQNGVFVNGTSVPPYTYLTEGLKGIGFKIGGGVYSSRAPIISSSDLTSSATSVTNITDLLLAYFGPMQSDLAKLRYVLASDKDIEMAQKQEPVKDAIKDSFTGDSNAAVKPGTVGDMAGFSGDLQGAFTTGANASDAFGAITGSDSWLFWSQETADSLNAVDDYVDEMTFFSSDYDFIHFYDPSALDSYLSGGDAS